MALRGRSKLFNYNVFFVTTTTLNWNHIFNDVPALRRVQEILFYSVKRSNARLHGYVLMKNHLHLLIQIPGGGKALSSFMRNFKMSVARKLYKSKGQIWQSGFDDVAIFSQNVFNTKLRYIHENPVRAGYVKNPEDWEFSSASAWLGEDSTACATITL